MPLLGLGLGLDRYFKKISSESFILDTITALNAYSLRKLKSNATKAIRVRRSSDNQEQDIGFVGEDLDEASLLAFVGAVDGYVVTMYNQVDDGTTCNYTQPTQNSQPQIVKSGVVVKQNGKVSIDFKPLGVQKNLLVSKIIPQSHTAFLVLYGNTTQYIMRNQGDFNWYIRNSRLNAGVSLSGSTVNNKLIVLSAYFNGANSVLNVDNNISIGDGGTNDFTNATLGFSMDGFISEFIMLNNSSDNEILRDNQQTYYSIV